MLKKICLAVVGLVFASQASAIVITNLGGAFDGMDVGVVDTLIAQTGARGTYSEGVGKLVNSSPETEGAWVNGILDPDVSYATRAESVKYYLTNESNVFAFALQSDPGFYIIKNSTFWALFENKASLGWAVFSTSGLSGGFNLPDLKTLTISHVSEFSGVSAVPVPNSLFLLSVVVGGFTFFRRKKLQAK